MISTVRRATGLAVAILIAVPAAASAAPPSNDDRTSPAQLGSLPAQVGGTLVEATRQPTDPLSGCGANQQVWYRFVAPADGRIAARLQADGQLDATLDAFRSVRSQLSSLACDFTDAKGLGAINFTVKKGDAFFLSVSRLSNSVAGTFTLTVVAPQPAAKPPGKALPKGGADGTLDRVGNIDDAYAVRMRAGRTYRMRLSGRRLDEEDETCQVSGALYAPGSDSFDSSSVKSFGCDSDGYATFTPGPGEGGRYSVLVSAAGNVRTLQSYHVEVAGAAADDTAPGRFLANRRTARGSLNGARIDALDLYRFTVAKRSDLTLRLRTGGGNGFDLLLLNERGRRVQCACGESGDAELKRELAPGRYFVVARARDASAGSYRLTRSSRVLTRTRVGFSKKRAGLGSLTPIRVKVTPSVAGPVTVIIQRFDPLEGWLFFRLQRTRAAGGRASIGFVPPTVGRWRARATFDGTVGSGSSQSGFAQVLVVAREAD